MLTDETKQSILDLQKMYPIKRSALLPALHLAQAEVGYLPREVQDEVAVLFDLDPNEVNAVVTFYDMFFDEPVGKHLIHVCTNISCMLHGSDSLLDKVCHKLKVKLREVTSDGEFCVFSSECLAACDRAPMMLVDDKVVGPVEDKDLDRILEEAKNNRGHSSPIYNQEVENA